MAKVQILREWGFRGRGGKRFQVLETLVGGAEALVAELKESGGLEMGGLRFFERNTEIPQEIRPGIYEAGYQLVDLTYDHGGSGEGEYFFHTAS